MQHNWSREQGHLQLIISIGLVGVLVSILSGYAYYGMFSPTSNKNQSAVVSSNVPGTLLVE